MGLDVQNALKLLSDRGVTRSEQMLRRWLRQGKIKATLPSKKHGYLIDSDSLEKFIKSKIEEGREEENEKEQLKKENAYLRLELERVRSAYITLQEQSQQTIQLQTQLQQWKTKATQLQQALNIAQRKQ